MIIDVMDLDFQTLNFSKKYDNVRFSNEDFDFKLY